MKPIQSITQSKVNLYCFSSYHKENNIQKRNDFYSKSPPIGKSNTYNAYYILTQTLSDTTNIIN
jgi:hypothetical protein